MSCMTALGRFAQLCAGLETTDVGHLLDLHAATAKCRTRPKADACERITEAMQRDFAASDRKGSPRQLSHQPITRSALQSRYQTFYPDSIFRKKKEV